MTTAKAKAGARRRKRLRALPIPRCARSSARPISPARTRRPSAATWSPTRCARSKFPTSRSIPARAIAGCTIPSSTSSATRRRRCCSVCTRKARSPIAQGYAKVTGKAMAAAVHSNVGLFHATMAIFNAWCDRQPVVVLGATGPVDAVKRRPWIDWIHTARDQGAIVRNYTKWDDQPASPAAAREALIRATWIARHGAQRAGLHQSRRRDAGVEAGASRSRRSRPPVSCRSPIPTASAELIEDAATILKGAQRPVDLDGAGVAQHRRLE